VSLRCNAWPESLSRVSAVTVQLGNELKGEGFMFIAIHPGELILIIASPGICHRLATLNRARAQNAQSDTTAAAGNVTRSIE